MHDDYEKLITWSVILLKYILDNQDEELWKSLWKLYPRYYLNLNKRCIFERTKPKACTKLIHLPSQLTLFLQDASCILACIQRQKPADPKTNVCTNVICKRNYFLKRSWHLTPPALLSVILRNYFIRINHSTVLCFLYDSVQH